MCRRVVATLVGLLGLAFAPAPTAHLRAYKEVRDPMCRAVISEMHIEIHKHSLRKNGEEDIYETVPAICLAIIQHYTLRVGAPPSGAYTLEKRTVRLDDDIEVQQTPAPSSTS